MAKFIRIRTVSQVTIFSVCTFIVSKLHSYSASNCTPIYPIISKLMNHNCLLICPRNNNSQMATVLQFVAKLLGDILKVTVIVEIL